MAAGPSERSGVSTLKIRDLERGVLMEPFLKEPVKGKRFSSDFAHRLRLGMIAFVS